MRIDQLDVVLRSRSQWEAMELGTALVRRHAGVIWKSWLLLTLPLFVLLNLGGWWLDNFWLPALLLWWLKPVFERIPLYVISRGAFGAEPGIGETLRAQWHWGWRGLWAHLGWRRLSPARTLMMPVDLLEGGDASQRRMRRRVLGGGAYGHAVLLTWVCLHFEWMLQVAGIALVFMFVPLDLLPESLRAAASLIGEDTPWWAWVGFNLLAWAAMTLIGPFYSGAGFGLYLNRRTQLEAWDVEIAFRRLRERLSRLAPVLLLVLAWGLHPPAMAQEHDETETVHVNHKGEVAAAPGGRTPTAVFGDEAAVDTAGFRQAVARTYEDPQLGSSRTTYRWQRKHPLQEKEESTTSERDPLDRSLLGNISKVLAFIGESILWIVLGIALLVLLLTARHWLPWLRGSGRRRREAEPEATQHALALPETLPPDILASARKLWREGKPRHALALLYRASLDVLAQRADIVLPPGSTEAQCLRASRRMPDEADRQLFARTVRTWQYAAYAGRLPDEQEFEALADALHRQYGWPA